ncbi:T9SS type A sorting domain-containing protein [Flavobacterium sp. SM15]|uniref:ELWxxDGT repeat protein n=1 Tax=Flavobacterium sp. SM15 TaxID=2908005 RepID=UPI001EDC0713|nr:ELWxxDGT repeat protein [Flavobacterium sp. SM15]MCG2611156.1 T9SS type A sorting domain-containing protein [Flavobacterium sp. SM15]
MKKSILLIIISLFITDIFSQNIDVTEIELNNIDGSNPKNLTKGLTKIYFSADDGLHGEELWVHDVTLNSTYLVKDINSGSSPGLGNSVFLTIGDILYFTTNRDLYGTELWRSDGTETGTYLVKHINSNYWASNTIYQLFNYNGNIIFSANDDVIGQELWISDGTTNGTTVLKDIYAGTNSSNPSNFTIFNGEFYFTANNGTNGREIWKSNGTTSGTTILKDINPGSNSGISGGNLIVFNDNLFFFAYTSTNGFEPWKSDGTESGTQLFKDIAVGSNSSNYGLSGISNTDYFIFEVDSPTIGKELWKSDGTVTGTVLLKDINPTGNGISDFAQYTLFNNKIYFIGYNSTNGYELWYTDGTTVGTQLVKDIRTGSSDSNITKLTATSNFLIFSATDGSSSYNTLWKSDGTYSGTILLENTNLSHFSNPQFGFVEFNNSVFFAGGYNSPNGVELWTTNGANTQVFKDIFHRYSGMTNFYDSVLLNDKIIFTGNNGNGNEPFISDGTIMGTHIIKDINPGNASSSFTSSGYRSASYTKAGNYVFFRAGNSISGHEIWKTDGTEVNTSIVKDIRPGNASSISEYMLFMEYNGIFYFKADDGIHGEELWRSDGTSTGTYLLKDINIGSGSSMYHSNIYYNHPDYLNEKCYAVLNGYLYFVAKDGTDSSIWRTDGTESGTIKVISIPSSGNYDNERRIVNANNNRIFFKTNINNSSYGNDSLWSSDGTQAGTTLLTTANITGPIQFKKNIVHNNFLYYTIYTSNGCTLMKTDGTLSGTMVVKENFTNQSTFNSLTSCGNNVYFTVGSQGVSGKELWRTDGTTNGTIKLEEIPNSSPQYFIDCNTCYQNNLLYHKEIFDNKIWFVNDYSTDASSYLTTNIVNSENFGNSEGVLNLMTGSNGLYISGSKQYAGTELYFTNFNIPLSNQEFTTTSNNIITVYPNPTNSKIHIKTSNNIEIQKIKIYDLLGKEIHGLIQNNDELELSGIDNGIYFLKIFTDKSIYTRKIILKK